MNRDEYRHTRAPRGQVHSPPRSCRLLSQDLSRTSSFRNQASVKQDLNIDEFGDMGSDEDDFQALACNYLPPKPPPRPQYNLVPYGFLRDDDELADEDYDGVPIDESRDSHKKQSRLSSPLKPPSDEIRGDPITVLGSFNRPEPLLQKLHNDSWSQPSAPRSRQAPRSSTVDINMIKISDRNQQREAGRWDQKIEPASNVNINSGKAQNFVRGQDQANPLIQSGSREISSLSFVKANDSGMSFTKACNKPSTSSCTSGLGRGSVDSNPSIKAGNKQTSSGSATVPFPSKGISSHFLQSVNNSPRWDSKPGSAQSSTPVWVEQGRTSSHNSKRQALPSPNQIATPTSIANTAPQIDLLQAAALQQALAGLTQLGSQSGMNLLGVQNLLIQATQNPTLAAVLVGTGLGSNTFSNSTVESLLKSTGTTAAAVTQSNSSVVRNLPQPNIIENSSSTSHEMPIPDGAGATRYPAPDVSSLIFDPSTGYRFDPSTGLHYDANSGYFFNSQLKIYLRWDKFTQTYLRVEKPPGVTLFNYSKEQMSVALRSTGDHSSSSSNTSISKNSIRSTNTFSTGGVVKESHHVPSPMKNVLTSSLQKESHPVHTSLSSIPTDLSKPPPPLPQTIFSGSGWQQIGMNSSNASERKAAALPNLAETSLFNKLRKAKLGLNAQMKPDLKRWGSPDPLLEAQKHGSGTNNSDDGILNLKEILQRSRQFMKQKTGNQSNTLGAAVGGPMRKDRSRSGSRDRRRIRSPSFERSSRRSKSHERRRNPDSKLRKIPHSQGISPSRRGRGRRSPSARKKRSSSKSRSPTNRARGKPNPSPEARKRKSRSRGRTPINKVHRRATPSPEARKRTLTSRGRSPLRRNGKFSKSPESRQRRPISKDRSPGRRPRVQLSISPELRKSVHHSRTPNRSQSPKVKVVLNQSPGGSKVQVSSPGQNIKRSADRVPSTERRSVRRKLSPSNPKSSHIHENEGENIAMDKITGLKPISHESPKICSKRASGSNESKDVSGYKSLSNLRNQGKDHSREKETPKEQGDPHQHRDKSPAVSVSTKEGIKNDSDDEKRSRANHRLVSERTFCKGWKRKEPDSVSEVPSTKKTGNKTKLRLSAEDTQEFVDEGGEQKLTSKKDETIHGTQLEETDEYDFLNETLDDDDKESTVIDEYEEILDYQDLEGGISESLRKESASKDFTQQDSQSKVSLDSPVIDLCLDPSEPAIEASTSADFNLEILHHSPVENALASQIEEDPVLLKNKTGLDEDKDGVEILDSDGLEVGNEPGVLTVEISEKEGSRKSDEASNTHDGSSEEVDAETQAGSEKITEASTEIKDLPNNSGVDSASHQHASGGVGPEIMDKEEWNIVDSVEEREENILRNVAKDSASMEVSACSSTIKQVVSTKREENNDPFGKLGPSPESPKAEGSKCDSFVHNGAAAKTENGGETKALDSKVETDDDKGANVNRGKESNDKPDPHVAKEDDKHDKTPGQGCKEDGNSKGTSPERQEEAPVQVRSVSDIEKFLLLSSQEVEVKREQGINPTASKTEKKSGIFSRLGEKLQADEAGGKSPQQIQLPEDTSVSPQGPSKIVTPPVVHKTLKAKAVGAAPKNAKQVVLKDPVGTIFNDDKPTSTIMIGPMNFIEPLKNFQNFTQKYILRHLQQENVQVRKVHVCHEDVTGAPYHYVLLMFYSLQSAADWFKKHKGRFIFNEKVFKHIPGNKKQKIIPGAETFLHYSENNWTCNVCKKGNFPPRSLCFGCFQHKDPEGFSPVTILDVGQHPWKSSTCVGTPKLKFFVSKEKVLASAPPLDGFDIKRIEMIMDEKMGFPAGICVFELSNIIDAGKLKKYLNRRGVEAVSVELHEKPKSAVTVGSRKTFPKESTNDRMPKSLNVDVPGPVSRSRANPSEERERGVRECSPRFPSREPRVPRGSSPSLPRNVKGRSPGPSKDVRAPRGRSPSPSPQVRILRRCSPSPLRSRLSRDRIRSRSPGYRPRSRSPINVSRAYIGSRHPSPEGRSVREFASRELTVREVSPRYDIRDEYRRSRSRERSPEYQSPPRYRSRSPFYDAPRRRSPSSRYRAPSPIRPIKPDGRGDWRYPPPDPNYFRYEPKSGLDYDPTTTLYCEPRSCCFYNDDTNEWLEYDPKTGCYLLVR